MDIVCLQLPYRKKEITTRELTNRKQMGAYTVPTKGQRTASRLSLYQLGAKGESPSDNTRILNKPNKYNNIVSRSRFQSRIWPPTLNTKGHGILIAQVWI
jgi:hypothetical protein